mgnify:CR=1 FL=1
MLISFRVLVLILATWCAITAAFPLKSRAQEISCKSLRGATIDFIVPHSVGGGFDTYARLLAPFLEDALDAEIVVTNRSGAGGTIGAGIIHKAAPNGRTIGILNAAGLMVKAMAGSKKTPNPATDFTILARVMRIQQVWAVPESSPFTTIGDVLAVSEERPVVFGMRDVGSTSFVNAAVVSHLLGMPIDIVAGYKGTQAKSLAGLRGEVDLNVFTFETVLSQIENGDLKPVLQISGKPIDEHPSLRGVPVLGGEDGLAARRALMLERSKDQAVKDAAVLIGLIGAGRLIVAPPGMDDNLVSCLEETLFRVLQDPKFQQAANRSGLSLNIARGDEALSEIKTVAVSVGRFIPIFEEAIIKARE